MRRLELVCDLGVLKRNALEIRKRVPQSVKMLCVVKADAYGHGAVQTARTLLDAGLADAFAVATPEEGLELYESGLRDKPIVVLGQISDYADAILSAQCGLSQAVDSPKNAELMDGAAAQTGKTAKLHIKIDSGMSRTGVKGEDELRRLLDEIKTLRNVKVEGLFTHFCAADEDEAFTKQQNAAFAKAKEICGEYGFMPVCHAAASTAMLHREYQYDMVRAGIALYGTGVKELENVVSPAQTLLSHVVSIRRVLKGETVGYSRTFTSVRDSLIATIPCGYGDGYPRLMSNRGCVLIEGRRAPIAGNVCMDMLMADVTDIPSVTTDTGVVLMGSMGNERITPDEIAAICKTIPYEIMLGFTNRVHRSWTQSQEG